MSVVQSLKQGLFGYCVLFVDKHSCIYLLKGCLIIVGNMMPFYFRNECMVFFYQTKGRTFQVRILYVLVSCKYR